MAGGHGKLGKTRNHFYLAMRGPGLDFVFLLFFSSLRKKKKEKDGKRGRGGKTAWIWEKKEKTERVLKKGKKKIRKKEKKNRERKGPGRYSIYGGGRGIPHKMGVDKVFFKH